MDIGELRAGKPALLVTNRHSDAYKVISAFLSEGVAMDHKLHLAMHNNISLDLLGKDLQRLTAEAVEAHFDRGRLALIHAPDLYLKDGVLDPASFKTRLETFCRTAETQGYTASRLVVDLGWARDFGLVEELAEWSVRLADLVPATLYHLDVCYAEDYTIDALLLQMRGYDRSFFQNGTVSVAFERQELESNQKLVTLLLGALTDTAALVRANRDAGFLVRLAAETAYRGSPVEISQTILEMTASHYKADFALLRHKRGLSPQGAPSTISLGAASADLAILADHVEATIDQRHALLSEPKLIYRPHSLFEFIPGLGMEVLVVIPLVDEGLFLGFLVLGGGKPSFAKDTSHDNLVSLARTAVSAYRRHVALSEAWSSHGGNFGGLHAAGEMIAGVAHGFNNALAVINAYAQLIAAESGSDSIRELAEQIRTSVSDATELVQRIQVLVAGDRSGVARVALSDLARQSVEITRPKWQMEPLARGKRIDLEHSLQSTAIVAVNPAALREAVSNLIINACEAMPNGGSLVVSTWSDADTACLSVADDGTGIAEAMKPRLFESFATTKGAGNSGLGLAIAKSSVEAAGGTIVFTSQPGRGTTVTIALPIGQPEADVAASTQPGPTEGVAMEHLLLELADKAILIVDDDALVRDALGRLIRLGGGTVRVASRPDEALDTLRSSPCDLVITDFALPGMTGLELAGEIKREHPDRKVVLLTGWLDPAVDEQAAAVADLVLRKPLTAADTLRVVRLLQ